MIQKKKKKSITFNPPHNTETLALFLKEKSYSTETNFHGYTSLFHLN